MDTGTDKAELAEMPVSYGTVGVTLWYLSGAAESIGWQTYNLHTEGHCRGHTVYRDGDGYDFYYGNALGNGSGIGSSDYYLDWNEEAIFGDKYGD